MNKVFALVDCNAFFCSCEILFRPDLIGKPVGVLSNNDGCFVSRTKELKKIGVKMGDPYFKVKDLCKKHNVTVFSSNFSLYTNLSDRVMAVLSQFSPLMEVYSVDEAFLDLTGQSDLRNFGAKIKRAVERNTGIPVGVGIGSTKTLAKIANHIAKKYPAYNGVVELTHKDNLDKALSHIKVNDIWGVGKASTHKLHSLKIYTAKDYRDYKNDRLIKKIFTKVGLQRKDELSGVSRFPLEVTTKKKKEIICSRTFGAPVFTKESLKESVANYVSSACEKLRKQSSVCGEITVFMRTSPFKSVSQYYAMDSIKLLSHSCDTRVLIKYAFIILEDLYQSGIEYKKAGIKLSEIRDKSHTQLSLFEMTDFISSDHLMKAMDRVNTREGSGSLKTAVCGVTNKAWAMNRNHKSKRFLTGWNDLKGISC